MKHPSLGQWDLHTLSNHDYFIARRAFFFDLATWGDEKPVDDPNQTLGLDRQTFLEMLAALNRKAPNRMIKVGGLTPWAFKYTDHPTAMVPSKMRSFSLTRKSMARLNFSPSPMVMAVKVK